MTDLNFFNLKFFSWIHENLEFEISALKIRNLILVWIRIKLCTFLHSRGTTEQNS